MNATDPLSISRAAVNAPPDVRHPRLVEWVHRIAMLAKPDSIVWCDGSAREYGALCDGMVAAGTLHRLDPAKRPEQFPGAFRSRRRRARRGPHVHLQRAPGRRGADEQLGRAAGDAAHAEPAVRRLHARAHDVRGPVLDGSARQSDRAYRRRDHRQSVCRRQHAHDDADGLARLRRARRERIVHSLRAFGGCAACVGRAGRRMAVQSVEQVHRAFSRGARDLELRLRLWRQRAARQEVLRAAHRVGDGPRRGVARGAHADSRRDVAGRREALRRRGFSERVRQDEFRDADSAGGSRGLARDDDRRRHRMDQAGTRRRVSTRSIPRPVISASRRERRTNRIRTR